MPEISVLMSVYKTNPKHLCQTIKSVLEQTYSDFEFLILNDSPDETYLNNLIQRYPDSRIRLIQNEQTLGIANSHNKLLALATGKYIAMMDHDDIMDKNRLAEQVAYMESNPNVGICGTAYRCFGLWNKRGLVRPPIDSDDIKAELFFKCPILHPSIMIRSDIVKSNHITYNPNYISANDRHLYLDMMPYTDFHNLPEVLMNYRMHANMTSKTKREAIVSEQKRLRSEMLASIGAELSANEEQILNDFVLKGRCRIKDINILSQVKSVLEKIDTANQKSCYFPTEVFSKLCAKYLVKRCLNAAVYGRLSSKDFLKQTTLPVQNVKIPLLLKLLNNLLPSTPKESEVK